MLLHINATFHPTREWLSQQFRNAFLDLDTEPTLCISDNDGIYGTWLKTFLKESFQITLMKIPYRKPWYNGKVERFHKSLKLEALKFVVPISLAQLQRICGSYKDYYNGYRCNQALNGSTPKIISGNLTLSPLSFEKVSHMSAKITTLEPRFSAAA